MAIRTIGEIFQDYDPGKKYNLDKCVFVLFFDFQVYRNCLTLCNFSDRLEKRFLSLGFGGMVNGRTSHCFPLNGNSRDPYCYGIEGIIDAYYSSLEHGTCIYK